MLTALSIYESCGCEEMLERKVGAVVLKTGYKTCETPPCFSNLIYERFVANKTRMELSICQTCFKVYAHGEQIQHMFFTK